MTIRPFKFKLKKISEADLRLADALFSFLPSYGVEGSVKAAVSTSLKKQVGSDVSLSLESIFQESFSSALGKFSESAIHAIFGVEPINRKAICEIDPVLSLLIVDRVLGGRSSSLPDPRPATDTELGVLQYVMVQLMASIYHEAGESAPVHFRFDRFSESVHKLSNVAEREDGVVVLVFRISIGKHAGFIKLVVPNPFIEEAFLNNLQTPESLSEDQKEKFLERLASFGFVSTVIWGEAGRTSLSPSDLSSIEEGDIVLFDSSNITLEDGVPAGSALLRIGDGLEGAFKAKLSVDKKIAKCEIADFYEGE